MRLSVTLLTAWPLRTMFDHFNEWLCKTNFSFLQGASHPRDLVETASRLGYQSLCINDFDGAYGLARCYRELERLKQQGRQAIIRWSQAELWRRDTLSARP